MTDAAVKPNPKSARTVTVACKVPHGIIMQLCKPTMWLEETPSGTRERTRYDRCGDRVFIRGNSYPNNPPPGFPERKPTIGGYGMTPNVNAEFFAEWLKQNAKAPIVKNNLIFAMATADATREAARDMKDVRSGLEPLDMGGKDPRIPKPTNAAVGPIVTADVSGGA